MNIARILPRTVRQADGTKLSEPVIEIGKEQGWLGLPIRIGIDPGTGFGTMTSAWEPSPEELAALAAGAKVHVQLLGHGLHPPIMVLVGDPPEEMEGKPTNENTGI
jgi:hypothetical protein